MACICMNLSEHQGRRAFVAENNHVPRPRCLSSGAERPVSRAAGGWGGGGGRQGWKRRLRPERAADGLVGPSDESHLSPCQSGSHQRAPQAEADPLLGRRVCQQCRG